MSTHRDSKRDTAPVTVTLIRSTEPIDLAAWIERYAAALVEATQRETAKEAA